jgi:hypothetical protein
MECSSCKIESQSKYNRKSEVVESIRSDIMTRTEFLMQELNKQKASLMKKLDAILNDRKINPWESVNNSKDNLKEILGLYKTKYPLNYAFASENDLIEILTDIAYDSTSLDLIKYKFIPSCYSPPPDLIGTIIDATFKINEFGKLITSANCSCKANEDSKMNLYLTHDETQCELVDTRDFDSKQTQNNTFESNKYNLKLDPKPNIAVKSCIFPSNFNVEI